MTPTNRLEKLSSFIEFLERRLGWEFDRDDFDDRFKLQKYIFFAKRLGLSAEYQYNLYVFGAYSPALAQDYYEDNLSDVSTNDSVVSEFDSETFTQHISERDLEWLEIASTVVLLYERYQRFPEKQRKDKTISGAIEEKGADQQIVDTIYNDLDGIGII